MLISKGEKIDNKWKLTGPIGEELFLPAATGGEKIEIGTLGTATRVKLPSKVSKYSLAVELFNSLHRPVCVLDVRRTGMGGSGSWGPEVFYPMRHPGGSCSTGGAKPREKMPGAKTSAIRSHHMASCRYPPISIMTTPVGASGKCLLRPIVKIFWNWRCRRCAPLSKPRISEAGCRCSCAPSHTLTISTKPTRIRRTTSAATASLWRSLSPDRSMPIFRMPRSSESTSISGNSIESKAPAFFKTSRGVCTISY